MAFDPGFEVPGTDAGDADGWEVSISNSTQRYASFNPRAWGVERFEDGFDNDAFVTVLTELILEYAEFGIDDDLYDSFEWYVYIPSWDEITAEEYAEFDEAGSPVEAEGFEYSWENDDYLVALVSYIIGDVVEPYTFTTADNRCRVRLERSGWPTFDTTIVIPPLVLPNTYTATTLAAEMQSQVDAALIAAGGAYGAGDILFYPYKGRLAIVNTKQLYKMTIYTGDADGWPILLDYTPGRFDFRFHEEDVLETADYDWTGQYNSDTLKDEDFERDWGNSETSAPWEFMRTLVPWIDGTEDPLQGGAQVVIQAGVNDTFSMHVRIWLTGNVVPSAVLTIPAGSYPMGAFITAFQNVINAWLIAAGAPFGAGNVTVEISPSGTIRLRNTGPSAMVMYCTDLATDLWDFLGMPYDDDDDVEDYPQPISARWEVNSVRSFALFNTTDPQEDFETGWP